MEETVIDPLRGWVACAVISTGGIIGFGGRYFVIPLGGVHHPDSVTPRERLIQRPIHSRTGPERRGTVRHWAPE
ncbi:MAG: hypothetical protein HYX83_01905 [Chloroflexi bacterium]|nr:hypothetical protein [Chloroflexota bacterium]